MDSGRPDTLPDDYYLRNFHALVGYVFDTYQDLFTSEECTWYESIRQCDESAQRLYVRLLTRKGNVFRLSRLKYPEIVALGDAASQLASHQLSVTSAPDSLSTLIQAYTKPELLRMLSLETLKSKSRVELVDFILAANPEDQHQYLSTLQNADSWISINGHAFWNLYNLCFFGNLYQDSSEFVLRDLGAVEYEDYEIPAGFRAFKSRSHIDAHMRYFECVALWDLVDRKSTDALHSLLTQLPEVIPGDLTLLRRCDRLRNSIARQLERLGDLDEALRVFSVSMHPPARERCIRILLAKNELDAADALLEKMLAAPNGESELQVATRLKKQLSKARGLAIKKEPRYRPETSTLTLMASEFRVEEVARKFYSQFGNCSYTENCLVNGVLGLFIWDIVFHPINGAFFNPFQYAPADFYDPDFRIRRSALLEDRFREMDEPLKFPARVMENYVKHEGKSNPLVRWGGLPYELLSLALQRIPFTHWRAMFERILSNPRENMAGFPDLVLFKTDDSHYEFIEIKGPGDTVQQNQLRWMRYFTEHRIPCRVVNVKWSVEQPNHEPL